MRLLTLLLMGIVPMLASSQSRRLLKKDPYKCLDDYSYLIVVLHIDSQAPYRKNVVSNATGFFIRQKDSLYLVSARHVFTGYDVYGDELRSVTPTAISVWYWDTKQQLQSKTIYLPPELINESRKNASIQPDVYVLNVTGNFDDGKINSIEQYLPGRLGRADTLSPRDTVTAYGYSDEPKFPESFTDADSVFPHLNHTPVGYIARCIIMPPLHANAVMQGMTQFYYTIKPGLRTGTSGAPIFKISKTGRDKQIVIFAGIQSGTKGIKTNSTIVKGYLLSTLYNIK